MSDYSKMYNTLGGFINQHKGQITEVLEGVFRNNEDLYLQYNNSIDSILSGNLSGISPEVAGSFLGVLTIFSIEKGKFLGLQSLPDGVSNFSYKGVVECCSIYFDKNLGTVGEGIGSYCRTDIEQPSSYTEEMLEEDYKVLCELIDENTEEDEEEDDELKELASQYEDTIILTVSSLMDTFKLLFESCYEIPPYGILGADGAVYSFNSKNEMVTVKKSALSKLYNIFSTGLKRGTKTPDFTNEGYDIFYGFLACIAFGRRLVPSRGNSNVYPVYVCENQDGTKDRNITWGKYSVYLKKQLTSIIEKALQKELEDMTDNERGTVDIDKLLSERYVKRITNCCIITEYNIEVAMKLIYLNNKVDGSSIANQIEMSMNSKELLQGRGEVRNVVRNNGVTRLSIVFDDELYSRVPLFAFQAVELMQKSGKRPSWKNVVLGRDTEDKLYSASFARGDKFATSIVAGSGSGKGVMTLNILAAAIADNIPVMYLDSKPDMSLTVSELAAETGHKAFSYDALSPRLGSGFEDDAFFSRANIPDYVSDVLGHSMAGYCSISYLKAYQLCLLLSNLRKQVIQKKQPISGARGTLTLEDLGGEYIAVVADEFLAACNNFYSSVYLTYDNYAKDIPTKEREDSMIYKYAKKIKEWDLKLSSDLADYYTQTGRISGMNTITLLQKVKSSSSNEPAEKLKVFDKYFSNQNGLVKFLGRGVADGQQGTLALKGTSYGDLLEKERNWCQVEQRVMNKPEKGEKLSYPIFKAYLVVNDIDENSRCMKQLRETPGIERVIGEVGNANPAIAFKGYIELLAKTGNGQGNIDIGEQLERSYTIMNNIVHCMGYSGSLDDYLYDYDIDNFKNVDTLTSYVKDYLNGQSVDWHSGSSDGDYSESYDEDGNMSGNVFMGDYYSEEQEQEDQEPYQANSESLQGNSGDLSQDELNSFADSMTQSLGSVMNSQEERWREQLMSIVVNLWGKFGDSLPFDRDTYMRASEIAVNEFIEKKKARV